MISIVLPTYNRLYSLKTIFFPSLEKQDFLDYELIIIDDGSNDGTEQYFSDSVFLNNFKNISQRFKYIKNNKNLGAPLSRNIGVNIAKGEWIWITEDDIEIKDESFFTIFENIIQNISSDVGVISPRREEGNSLGYYNLPNNEFSRIGRFSGEIYINPLSTYNGFVSNTHCSSFIKKDVYLNVGGQDGITFYGNTFRDESDLYSRIVKKGFKIHYFGDILVIFHRNDISITGGQKKINNKSIIEQEFILIKNHYYYLRKNYTFYYIRIIFFIFVRGFKILSNVFGIKKLKNILAINKI